MNFLSSDWRDRRAVINQGISYGPMLYTIANYSTTAKIEEEAKMKSFEEEILTKIHSIPDPLRKNLADTVITADKNKEDLPTPVEDKQFYFEPSFLPNNIASHSDTDRSEFYPSLTGITSFFSNVFGAISDVMFHRRPKSPAPQYYDSFECNLDTDQKMAAENWQSSKNLDENKRAQPQTGVVNDTMNNCRATVAQCENKINAVRNLLINKTVPTTTTKVRYRRPRKAFVDASAVKTSSEEEFAADNYVSLSNEEYVEYFAVPSNSSEQLSDIKAAKMKTELAYTNTEIIGVLPNVSEKPETKDGPEEIQNSVASADENTQKDEKKEIISSCEDKMAKLKAMLQEKRKKSLKSSNSSDIVLEPSHPEVKSTNSAVLTKTPISTPGKTIDNQSEVPNMIGSNPIVVHKPPIKPTKVMPINNKQDKKFKNPHRLTEKRKKTRMRKNIQDDLNFADEIDSDDISSSIDSPRVVSSMQRIQKRIPIPSPKDSFDEMKGRFHSGTPDSDDSFQIVFADSPKVRQMRRPSDCDSEDSFIVFEDSPDSCYTSNDVFGDDPSTEECDSDFSDSELSDSGCANDVCKLSHTFSRTVSDLTDESLYEDSKSIDSTNIVEDLAAPVRDEVDCAVSFRDICKSEVPESVCDSAKTGLLLNDEKKQRRKDQPPKKVTFSEEPPKVHVMRVWAFAARQARAGHWERHALDRERFKRRIADVDMAVSWVLKPQHRSRIMFQRFMPWWNQQKRKELAEKKKREEEERLKKQDEDIITEKYLKEIHLISEYEGTVRSFYLYNSINIGKLSWKKKVKLNKPPNKIYDRYRDNTEHNNSVIETVTT